MLRHDPETGARREDARQTYDPVYPSAFPAQTRQDSSASLPFGRNVSGPIALDDYSADEDDVHGAPMSAPLYSLSASRSQSRLYSPMRGRPATNQAASSSHFIVMVPPADLPTESLPSRSAILASHARRGILLPLYPTLGGQLYALAREYGLPSVGGISLYLLDDGSGNLGPRVSDATWASLWSGFFEEDDLDESIGPARGSDAELPESGEARDATQYFQWSALLQSLSAFETYRRLYRESVSPAGVIALMLLNGDNPRSLQTCVGAIHQILQSLSGTESLEVVRQAGALAAQSRYARIDEIIAGGLEPWLQDTMERLTRLGDEIHRQFMTTAPSRPPVAGPRQTQWQTSG